ncbi:hypothetical protein [Streptomyces sp. NPDC097619]|uniref:hypothetical protein n=1 Tax=Streptomyces sp. NPDC097619 TaxID=3157228 RepID=UPI0033185961
MAERTDPSSTLTPAGRTWDAVRMPRSLGAEVRDHLRDQCGPIIVEGGVMTFLVPARTTADHQWPPQAETFGESTYITTPAEVRHTPPGPYWLCSQRRPLTPTSELHGALLAVTGPRPEPPRLAPEHLARLTAYQLTGRSCALCGRLVAGGRLLGLYQVGSSGPLAEPRELRACA